MDVTFIIPVGRGHETLVHRAIESVEGQSIPAALFVIYDTDRRGAGWARNTGLLKARTPFTVFLDADDWIAPTFTERTLAAFDGKRYVYTDWWTDDLVHRAPDCAWTNNTFHVVTTLLPTVWALEVGGFDMALPGMEDTDFYLKLVYGGRCGKRLAEPLFHYGPDGQRSKQFRESPVYQQIRASVGDRYRGRMMPCCGDYQPMAIPASEDDHHEGDVLVLAMWQGNRRERGRISGRLYPRAGNLAQLWVDPRDIEAEPHKFARVREPSATPPETPKDAEFERFSQDVMRHLGAYQTPYTVNGVQQAGEPDVDRVLKLYRK